MKEPVFKILSTEQTDNSIVSLLQVDTSSHIFNGHFPDQPVVPGACMLQMVKDILEDAFKVSLRMAKADTIKFLNTVTPATTGLKLLINHVAAEDQIRVAAELSGEDVIFMKLQASFMLKV